MAWIAVMEEEERDMTDYFFELGGEWNKLAVDVQGLAQQIATSVVREVDWYAIELMLRHQRNQIDLATAKEEFAAFKAHMQKRHKFKPVKSKLIFCH